MNLDNNECKFNKICCFGPTGPRGVTGPTGATNLLLNSTSVDNASEYVPATTTQTQIVLQYNATVDDGTTIQVRNGSTVSNSYHDSSLFIIKIG